MAVLELMHLSISSGEAPCFKVICQGSLLAGIMTRRLQLAGGPTLYIVGILMFLVATVAQEGLRILEMIGMMFVLSVWLLLD